MIRIAKFVGAFLLVAFLVFGSIYFFNKRAIDNVFRNDLSEGTEWVPKTYSISGLVSYWAEKPTDNSLVSLTNAAETSVHFNGNETRSLSNLAHFLLIVRYAEAVDQGEIDAGMPVDQALLADIHVPGVEDQRFEAHLEALLDQAEAMPAAQAQAASKQAQPSLDALVTALAENNDPAFADYLQLQLGAERVREIPTRYGLQTIEPPLPWAGYYVGWEPVVQGKPFSELAAAHESMGRSAYHTYITELGWQYLTDREARKRMRGHFEQHTDLLFVDEKYRNRWTTLGQPKELAAFVQRVFETELLSGAAREHLYRLLNWPMRNDKINRQFERYVAIYDSRMGYLAGIDYGKARPFGSGASASNASSNISSSASSNATATPFEARAQVFIMENIPIGLFLHLSSNLMTQDVQQRIFWDPELQASLLTTLPKAP